MRGLLLLALMPLACGMAPSGAEGLSLREVDAPLVRLCTDAECGCFEAHPGGVLVPVASSVECDAAARVSATLRATGVCRAGVGRRGASR